jgi:hypothetical protein
LSFFDLDEAEVEEEKTAEALLIEDAVQNVDTSMCSELGDGRGKLRCEILVAARAKDRAVCEQDFDENLRFELKAESGQKKYLISAEDYCWLTFSIMARQDYCGHISNSNAEGNCLKNLRIVE